MLKTGTFTMIDIGLEQFVLCVPDNLDDYYRELLEKLVQSQMHGGGVVAEVRSVARSGMSRKLAFWMCDDNQIVTLNCLIAQILGKNLDNGLIKVKGCGMDMVWSTLYDFWKTVLRTKDGKVLDFSVIGNLAKYERLPIPW